MPLGTAGFFNNEEVKQLRAQFDKVPGVVYNSASDSLITSNISSEQTQFDVPLLAAMKQRLDAVGWEKAKYFILIL